jgi:hypothetical protein
VLSSYGSAGASVVVVTDRPTLRCLGSALRYILLLEPVVVVLVGGVVVLVVVMVVGLCMSALSSHVAMRFD